MRKGTLIIKKIYCLIEIVAPGTSRSYTSHDFAHHTFVACQVCASG